MPQVIELVLSPESAASEELIRLEVKNKLGSAWNGRIVLLKKSIDSRKKQIKMHLRVAAYNQEEKLPPLFTRREFPQLDSAEKNHVMVVGAGPAGLFAALRLIENGIVPVVVERGKDVQGRRRDLAAIHKQHVVNPDSNYCFGEGGAGTYSDGKLYTRSTKRGNVHAILETLVQFGAGEQILYDAHPHIGTNKLPAIIASMRKQIIESGGKVLFETRMTDIGIRNTGGGRQEVESVTTVNVSTGAIQVHKTSKLILATGHSARDIFRLLHDKKIAIEFKPFALGVRIEHPQKMIDSIQYHCPDRGEFLPAASYSLVEQVEGRGVYSFCMCPGGIIAPCATDPGEVVTNGWSPSKRNNPYANSGIVVPVSWDDIVEFHKYGPLAGMYFQQHVEQKCQQAAGGTQKVPGQRMTDFVNGKLSSDLPDCSYQPGVSSQRVDQILPSFIARSLKAGFRAFGQKMKGYLTEEAIVVAPESRTSSPVRIPRDPEALEHPEVSGLYPCGEGAGYAGGIISAAIDGDLVASAISVVLNGEQRG